MIYSVVCSKKDIGGMNIRERLIELGFNKTDKKYDSSPIYTRQFGDSSCNLYTIEDETIQKNIDDIECDFFIYATRHQAKSGERTLSCHFPGNFAHADYGGKPGRFCIAAVLLLKQSFKNLNELGKDSGYAITLEATHHGPLIRKPVMFIEIGSTIEQWNDVKAGEIIGRTIVKTIEEYRDNHVESAIGFGGTHYCSNFNKVELEEPFALSHICPKHSFEGFSKEILIEMIKSSDKKISFALLDWKGIKGEDKEKLTLMLDEIGLPWKKR